MKKQPTTRFRTWKSGKSWLYSSVALATVAIAGATATNASANATIVTSNKTAVSSTTLATATITTSSVAASSVVASSASVSLVTATSTVASSVASSVAAPSAVSSVSVLSNVASGIASSLGASTVGASSVASTAATSLASNTASLSPDAKMLSVILGSNGTNTSAVASATAVLESLNADPLVSAAELAISSALAAGNSQAVASLVASLGATSQGGVMLRLAASLSSTNAAASTASTTLATATVASDPIWATIGGALGGLAGGVASTFGAVGGDVLADVLGGALIDLLGAIPTGMATTGAGMFPILGIIFGYWTQAFFTAGSAGAVGAVTGLIGAIGGGVVSGALVGQIVGALFNPAAQTGGELGGAVAGSINGIAAAIGGFIGHDIAWILLDMFGNGAVGLVLSLADAIGFIPPISLIMDIEAQLQFGIGTAVIDALGDIVGGVISQLISVWIAAPVGTIVGAVGGLVSALTGMTLPTVQQIESYVVNGLTWLSSSVSQLVNLGLSFLGLPSATTMLNWLLGLIGIQLPTGPSTSTPASKAAITTTSVTLAQGSTFSPLAGFVSATDAAGNAVPASAISYSGQVNTAIPGVYQVTYSFVDPTNGLTVSKAAQVTVTAPATVAAAMSLTGSTITNVLNEIFPTGAKFAF